MTAPAFKTDEELRQVAHYRDVFSRTRRTSLKRGAALSLPKATRADAKPQTEPLPEWQRQETRFDDHVERWRVVISGRAAPMHAYAVWRAGQMGILPMALFGAGNRRVALTRQRLIYEVWAGFGASMPAIGRVFNRDHSTVHYAIRKIENLIDTGEQPPFDPATVHDFLARWGFHDD